MRHPLSRSYSGGTVYHDVEDGDGVDEWGQRRPRTTSVSRSAVPPTSWSGRGEKSAGSRISTGSAESSGSIGTKMKLSPPTEMQNASSDDTIHTPSTASSLSIPLPTTPQDEVSLNGAMVRKGRVIDKDKSLPPLPIQPILKKQPSQTTVGGGSGGKIPLPRSRAGSVSSGMPSASASVSPAAAALARVTSPGPVRPLQLPQRIASGAFGCSSGDRPPVPVPSVPPSLRNSTSQTLQPAQTLTSSRSVPGLSTSTSMPRMSTGGVPAPPSPTSGLVKPKPRTGTGMVYKKSSHSSLNLASSTGAGAGGSKIRAPMPLATASLASVSTAAMGGGGRASSMGVRARSRTPVTPSTPSTAIGQAF